MTQRRPLSPHLGIYRPQISSVTSALHRLTGLGLTLGLFVAGWWLVALASGDGAYQLFMAVATSVPGLLVLVALLWSLSWHLLSGVRHLALDAGYGFGPVAMRRSGIATIAGSFVLTLLLLLLI